MTQPRSRLDDIGRWCLVVGAILLLIGNLMAAAGRYTMVIVGGLLTLIGIIGTVADRFGRSRAGGRRGR